MKIIGFVLLFVTLAMSLVCFGISIYMAFAKFRNDVFFIWGLASVVFLSFSLFIYMQLYH